MYSGNVSPDIEVISPGIKCKGAKLPLYKLFIRLITTYYKVVTPFSISELPEAEPDCVSVTKPEASVVNSSAPNLIFPPLVSSLMINPLSSCSNPTQIGRAHV